MKNASYAHKHVHTWITILLDWHWALEPSHTHYSHKLHVIVVTYKHYNHYVKPSVTTGRRHTHTHTHTHTHNNYHNPHCACALRVKKLPQALFTTSSLLKLQSYTMHEGKLGMPLYFSVSMKTIKMSLSLLQWSGARYVPETNGSVLEFLIKIIGCFSLKLRIL